MSRANGTFDDNWTRHGRRTLNKNSGTISFGAVREAYGNRRVYPQVYVNVITSRNLIAVTAVTSVPARVNPMMRIWGIDSTDRSSVASYYRYRARRNAH